MNCNKKSHFDGVTPVCRQEVGGWEDLDMCVWEEEALSQALEKEPRKKRGGNLKRCGAKRTNWTWRGCQRKMKRMKEKHQKKKKKEGGKEQGRGGVGGGGLHPCVVLAASQQLLMKHFGSILDSVAHSVISFVPNNPPLL